MSIALNRKGGIKRPKYLYTYLLIAGTTLVNGWYFGYKSPTFKVVNGAQLVNIVLDTSDSRYCDLTYDYNVGTVAYEKIEQIKMSRLPLLDSLINRSLPYAFTIKNPHESTLMILPEQFKALKREYPDSLRRLFGGKPPEVLRKM